jgi:carboxypeptidase D
VWYTSITCCVFRTGFSYVNPECSFCDFVHNQTAVNEHMYSAMQSILRIFPFLQHKDIFMTGESYAGHYIPSMADYFTVLNKKVPPGDFRLPIAGIAIGNGWSIPRIQYNYGDFAYNIGIISSNAAAQLSAQYGRCKEQERRQDYSGQGSCNILGEILAASGPCPAQREVAADDDGLDSTQPTSNTSKNNCFGPILNYYDTRLYFDMLSDWPAGDNISVYYLNTDALKKAVHANRKVEYQECSAGAGKYLAILDGLGVQSEIVRLLEQGIPITFYNGQFDLICNHMGTDALLRQLQWSGSQAYTRAPEYVWTVPEHPRAGSGQSQVRQIPAGYAKLTPDLLLTFIVVIGASHMVPYDVPKASLDLIHRVINNQSFGDYRQDFTWTFTDETVEVKAKEEIEDLLRKVFNFFLDGPYAVDYTLILMCTLFMTGAACWSRGLCGRKSSPAGVGINNLQYVRIPTAGPAQNSGTSRSTDSST